MPMPAHLPEHLVLEHLLGAGGAGEVWLARDRRLERAVAVKVISPVGGAAADVARFRREARLMASVRHPALAGILSAELSGPTPYLVVEYLPGGSLADLLRAGRRWSAAEGVELMASLAEGLAALHGAGILHRDVKPGNVLFREDGSPCLSDFGLALSLDRTRLTGTGCLVGTPVFMPPEVILGATYEARDDVFELASTVHAAVAGRPVVAAEGRLVEVMARLLTEGRGAVAVDEGIGGRLRAVLEACCAAPRDERPCDGTALVALLRGPAVSVAPARRRAAPPPRPPRTRRPAAALLGLLLLVIVASVWTRGAPGGASATAVVTVPADPFVERPLLRVGETWIEARCRLRGTVEPVLGVRWSATTLGGAVADGRSRARGGVARVEVPADRARGLTGAWTLSVAGTILATGSADLGFSPRWVAAEGHESAPGAPPFHEPVACDGGLAYATRIGTVREVGPGVRGGMTVVLERWSWGAAEEGATALSVVPAPGGRRRVLVVGGGPTRVVTLQPVGTRAQVVGTVPLGGGPGSFGSRLVEGPEGMLVAVVAGSEALCVDLVGDDETRPQWSVAPGFVGTAFAEEGYLWLVVVRNGAAELLASRMVPAASGGPPHLGPVVVVERFVVVPANRAEKMVAAGPGGLVAVGTRVGRVSGGTRPSWTDVGPPLPEEAELSSSFTAVAGGWVLPLALRRDSVVNLTSRLFLAFVPDGEGTVIDLVPLDVVAHRGIYMGGRWGACRDRSTLYVVRGNQVFVVDARPPFRLRSEGLVDVAGRVHAAPVVLNDALFVPTEVDGWSGLDLPRGPDW